MKPIREEIDFLLINPKTQPEFVSKKIDGKLNYK